MVAAGRFGEATSELLRTVHAMRGLSGIDPASQNVQALFARDACRIIYNAAKNAGEGPKLFDNNVTLLLSYPRSGNTLLLYVLSYNGLCHVMFQPSSNIYIYYDTRCPPIGLDRPCLVKEHDASQAVYFNKILYAVRDGRNVLISLAYMVMKQNRFNITEKDDLPEFIRYLTKSYPYGDWASSVGKILAMRESNKEKRIMIARYEDFTLNARKEIGFVLPTIDDAQKDELFSLGAANTASIYELPEWGGGFQTQDANNLFFGWHNSRRGDYWRSAFTPAAKKAFHETGATEFLIELGYERDPDWWKH